jgi:hypothetical protein
VFFEEIKKQQFCQKKCSEKGRRKEDRESGMTLANVET